MTRPGRTFLGDAPGSPAAVALFEEDVAEGGGYVWNATRLWAWRPDLYESFTSLRGSLLDESTLSEREVAVLVAATVSTHGDSYCALAWGPRLAKMSDEETAAQVLSGVAAPKLSPREAALVEWARKVVRSPNDTMTADVECLREAGLADREIFEATLYITLRLVVATMQDALGAAPDPELADAAPDLIRRAITYGRQPSA